MIDDMFVLDSEVCIHGPMWTPFGNSGLSIDDWIKRMDRNGIDMAVIMNYFALAPDDQHELDLITVGNVRKYPDRLLGFIWSSPFWGDRALDEIRYFADQGIRGLKLYSPGHGNFPLDSKMLDPMMELMADLNWVVMAYTDIDSKVCSPFLGVRLATRFPTVPVILTHMGKNSDITHFVPDYVKDTPNVFLNTSDTPNLPEIVYKTPMAIIPERLLFGSNGPNFCPEVELKKLFVAEELYGLTKEEKRKVLGGNGARLFGLDISKYTNLYA